MISLTKRYSSDQLSGSAAGVRLSYSASAFCASTSSRPNHASRSGGNATRAPATRSPPTRLTTISPKAARFAQRFITRWVRQDRHEHEFIIEGRLELYGLQASDASEEVAPRPPVVHVW